MANSIDIVIGNQKYSLKAEEPVEHLREVAEMVKRKVDTIRKKSPSLSLQKAAMLSAFDLASDLIKSKKKTVESRAHLLSKAHQLLLKVEGELNSHS